MFHVILSVNSDYFLKHFIKLIFLMVKCFFFFADWIIK
jgi:hypothetical protein